MELFRQRHVLELYRPRGDEHPFAALASAVAASAELAPETRFDTIVERGTRRPFTVDEASLRAWAAGIEDTFEREMFGGLVLATSTDPALTFSYQRDFAYAREVTETVRIAIPWAPRPAWATTPRLAQYAKTMARAYGAPIAAWITHDLTSVIAWATARDRGLPAQLPDVSVTEGELAPFLSLLPRARFDRAAVPECVAWINVWSADVLERIGRERVAAQRWEHQEAADGGALLVASDEPPVREHPDAMRRIAALIDGLALGEVQRDAAAE